MSELAQAIEEMRNMRESYDQLAATADLYQQGRTALASAITAKGVPTAADTPLADMAENVGDIQQTTTILQGGDVYAQQLFGDADAAVSPLWNLYDVLAQMKSQYMGAGQYAALIVCEYYKGYDSLQLQGADAYYTCDGAFYDYDAIHVWNDADNGKANRWVCFLYQQEGARLDITNTAISPRSMYIGGHIGTIEYFVNGRLTDLVCGVEDTDVIDNFLSGSYTQSWGFNTILRNIKIIKSSKFNKGAGTIVLNGVNMPIGEFNNYNIDVSADELYINGNPGAIIANVYDLVISNCPTIDRIINIASSKIQRIRLLDTTKINGTNVIYPVYAYNLIDIVVNALDYSANIHNWNPTTVLANATKKAQLIENIKNHILARVSDRTGLSRLTFTISTNMYNAVSGETITWNDQTMTLADAFLTKNWLLAGA